MEISTKRKHFTSAGHYFDEGKISDWGSIQIIRIDPSLELWNYSDHAAVVSVIAERISYRVLSERWRNQYC
jgi:hypothetical protein